jgi:hypothetical protein
MKRDELELAGRIIPKAKRRDNVGSNSPLLAAGQFIVTQRAELYQVTPVNSISFSRERLMNHAKIQSKTNPPG